MPRRGPTLFALLAAVATLAPVPAPGHPAEPFRLPVEELVLTPIDGGTHTLGPGRYETLVEVGRHEGRPLLTFTAPHGADHVEHAPPSQRYLDTITLGLRESRGWGDAQVQDYLSSVLPAA